MTTELIGNIWLRHFKETGNPLFAWEIYLMCRQEDLPIPEDVLAYLDRAAEAILEVAENPPQSSKRPAAVAKALGLHKDKPGRGSVWTRFTISIEAWAKDMQIAEDAHKEIQEFGGQEDYAFEEVGKKHETSKSTVRRIYYRHLELGTFHEL